MKTSTILTLIFLTAASARAATVVLNWSVSANPSAILMDNNSTPLSAGTPLAGDGFLVQLGYYDRAILANPFRGDWVVLASSTIGDDGQEIAGRFSTTTILGGVPFNAPPVGTPLAIRFYDGSSVATSSFFNAVSDTSGGWNYVSPSDPAPVINMVINKVSGIEFQNTGVFQTTIPIPEVSSSLLFWIGVCSSMMIRSRTR